MNETDIAWAAGLFEGEGCIGLNRTNGRSYPQLQINLTDADVIRRFQRIVGGTLNGPYSTQGHKDRWVWAANGLHARRVLATLAPFLGERRTARMAEVLAQASTPTRSFYRRSEVKEEQ